LVVKNSHPLCLTNTRHKDVWGGGDTAPLILDLGTSSDER
jgi:hypothetical protein